jgi:hypothetical protein
MSKLPSMALLASLVILGACTQIDAGTATAPERGDPGFLKGVDTRADELYINVEGPAGGRGFRNVYIAQADFGNMQIIQPEGVASDDEWTVTESEDNIIQKAIAEEFSRALSFQSAYNIVDNREAAEIVVHTAVVAIHPNETRSAVAAGARPGGAITVSVALLDAVSDEVMVRLVDTKSSDDIWVFSQVGNNDPAINLIFQSWGNSIRRGMLQLQGRSNDPLALPIILKQQQ